MKSILTICHREFCGYFRSPVAYVFLAAYLTLTIGLTWFVTKWFDRGEANLTAFFMFVPWLFAIFIPAVGMRLWAEERRSGTWELLFTLPITIGQAVVGKFLAGWLFITLAILLTFPMPLTAAYLGDPDWGPIFSSYLGAIMMAGAYLGICSFTSSLTKNQVISFVIGACLCLLLVLLGYSPFNQLLISLHWPIWLVDAISNFSFTPHFEMLTKGLVTLKAVIFFGGLTIFTLGLNVLVLER